MTSESILATVPDVSSASVPTKDVTSEEKPSLSVLNDDCLGVILGYLSLRERSRLETVCCQWQRCLYRHVFKLYIDIREDNELKFTVYYQSNHSVKYNNKENMVFCCRDLERFRNLISKFRSRITRLSLIVYTINEEVASCLAPICSISNYLSVYHCGEDVSDLFVISSSIGEFVSHLEFSMDRIRDSFEKQLIDNPDLESGDVEGMISSLSDIFLRLTKIEIIDCPDGMMFVLAAAIRLRQPFNNFPESVYEGCLTESGGLGRERAGCSFLPCLNQLHLTYNEITYNEFFTHFIDTWLRFSTLYSRQIETLYVDVSLSRNMQFLQSLTLFDHLKSLHLGMVLLFDGEIHSGLTQLIGALELIADKKLTHLSFDFSLNQQYLVNIDIIYKLFDAIGRFRTLQCLGMNFTFEGRGEVDFGGLEWNRSLFRSFASCQHFRQFHCRLVSNLKDAESFWPVKQFWTGFSHYLGDQIETLDIECVNDVFVDLVGLPKLKSISIYLREEIQEDLFVEFVKSCPSLESVELKGEFNLTQLTIDAAIGFVMRIKQSKSDLCINIRKIATKRRFLFLLLPQLPYCPPQLRWIYK